MRLIAFISGCFLLFSCAKKEATPSELIGIWQRTETLMDIGDGSGQWSPVPTAEQTVINFKADGTINHNGHWYLSRFNRYSILSDTELRLYGATDSLTITYSVADKLTVNFQCIEACRDRFTKLKK